MPSEIVVEQKFQVKLDTRGQRLEELVAGHVFVVTPNGPVALPLAQVAKQHF